MATGNAELNYKRRRADAYTAPEARGPARPAYRDHSPGRRKETYVPPSKKTQPAKPAKKNEDDYHPDIPLKTLTYAEIRWIILVVFIVSSVAMGIIFLAAEAAMTQKEINDLKRGIAQADDDIANLKIEIEQSQNMQLVKKRAQEELGMSEPSFDQYVYINDLPLPKSDFGRYIKERAYGGERNQSEEPEEPDETQEE